MRAGDAHRAFESFPIATVDGLLGAGRALILAPHADDESLGCGGLIAACCSAGPERAPEVIVVTDGAASHPGSKDFPPRRLSKLRKTEARLALRLLGLPPARLSFLGLPDAGAPWNDALVDASLATITSVLDRSGCTTIIAPWGSDPHCDHQGTQHLARLAAKRRGVRLLNYPVWGWLLDEDAPVEESSVTGWRLDVQAHLPAKRRAIAAHRSQHGGLITDASDGFVLPAKLLSALVSDVEVFFVGS